MIRTLITPTSHIMAKANKITEMTVATNTHNRIVSIKLEIASSSIFAVEMLKYSNTIEFSAKVSQKR